jgi:hypothetical protein
MDKSGKDAKHKAAMQKQKANVDASIAAASLERGVAILLTGDGKGKSSSAFGMVMRALGYGQKVGVVQFIKGEQLSGEEIYLKEQCPQVAFYQMDYIRTARAKGLVERLVVNKHALSNALLPVVTVVGLQTGSLFAGAILTETIFAWPGMGRWIVNAIVARNFPVVQIGVMVFALIFIVVNLLVDISYGLLDPRIRHD